MYKINYTEYKLGIERDLMTAMIMALKLNRTTRDRVQQISKTYLSFADEPVFDAMMHKFRQLGTAFVEIREIVNQYWARYLEDMRRVALSRARTYMKNGNIDKALITMKGATHYV